MFSYHIILWRLFGFNAVSRRKYSAIVLTDEIAHGLSLKKKLKHQTEIETTFKKSNDFKGDIS